MSQRSLMDNDEINLEASVPFSGRTKAQGEIKASELVLAAIHHLKETKGSTRKEIMDYILQEYNCNSAQLKRSISMALKRGVQYGILRLENGHFLLEPIEDDNLIMVTKAKGCCRRRRRRGCRSRSRRRRSRSRCRSRRRRRSRKRRRSCTRRRRRSRKRSCRRRRSRRCPIDDDNE